MKRLFLCSVFATVGCAGASSVQAPAPTVEAPESRGNPAAIDQPVDVVIENFITPRTTIRVTLLEAVTGEQAFELAETWNRLRRPPPDGYQFLLARFRIEVLDRADPSSPFQLLGVDFRSVSGSGRVLPLPGLCCADEPLQRNGMPGESWEGWRAFFEEAGDQGTTIVYRRGRPEAVWFAVR